MKILHTESMGVSGGQTRRVIDELKIIKEAGHEAYLACRPETWLENEALKEGIETITMPLRHTVDPKSLKMLVKTILNKKIDIVHSHNSKDSYSAAIACKLTGRKFVRSKHSDFTKKPGPIYRLSDRIVTTGEKIRKELIDTGIPGNRILSLPSYPDEKRFIPDADRRTVARKRLAHPDKVLIGTLSGLSGNKRPHFIFPALKKLIERFPKIHYLIAGANKKRGYDEEFYRYLEESGVQDHVSFIGFTDPVEFLDAIDIFVCASYREGLPQTVMQAMMMGKAVVASRIGGIPDLNLEDNLLLVDRDDPIAFARALDTLLSDPARRQALGNKNRTLARRYFNRTVLAEKLMQLYCELLENKQC